MAQPRLIYANYVQAHGSAFDVALDFGHRFASEETPEPEVRVVMSWEHLSTMLPVLQGMIDHYQDQLGELPKVVARPEEEGAS